MSVQDWTIEILEPITDQIIGVPDTGTHNVFVQCRVTVDDGAPPDEVWAGVYKTDSASEPVPTDPDQKAGQLNYDDTGASGNGPYWFDGCISVPQGTNSGNTCATLSNVILAVWAGRTDASGTEYKRATRSLKGYDVYVDCPAMASGSPTKTELKASQTSNKARLIVKKAAKKKRR